MMVAGGRSADNACRYVGEDGDAQAHRQPQDQQNKNKEDELGMARITASVFTSHVPAIGAAMDLGKTQGLLAFVSGAMTSPVSG